MKKINQLCLAVIAMLCLLNVKVLVSANDNYNEDYVKHVETLRNEYILGGAKMEVQHLRTLDNGDANKGWYNSTLQYVEPFAGNDYQIVSWSKGALGEQGYRAYTVEALARDYEASHPGYIVAAAVNGDFFNNQGGGDGAPTNVHVQEGDVYRHTFGSGSAGIAIGFSGGIKAIFGRPTFSTTPNIHLLDSNGKSIDMIPTDAYNTTISQTGVSLFVKKSTGIDPSQLYVYQVANEIVRGVSNKFDAGADVFVKGTIMDVYVGSNNFPAGSDYTYITSPTPLNLEIGDTVKCQYDMSGSFANVTNVVSGHRHMLANGISKYQMDASDAHNYTKHPRTVIGLKADGTPILAVIDGRGRDETWHTGAAMFTLAEILKGLDCVEGFNLDGGGSSTLIVRNENNKFEVVNTPSDGAARSDGNAVLLVTRDNRLRVGNITDNSIQIKQLGQIANGTIKNIEASVSGQTQNIALGDSVTFTGLTRGTTYDVLVSYDIEDSDGDVKSYTALLKASLPMQRFPVLSNFKVSNVTTNSFEVGFKITPRELPITKVEVIFYDGRYEVEYTDSSIVIDNVTVVAGDIVEILISLEGGYEIRDSLVIDLVKEPAIPVTSCKMGSSLAAISLIAFGALMLVKRKD